MTLTDFLLARIAEDEAGYRAEAAGIEWLTVNGRDLWPKLLADCEAKRRIVELHTEDEEGSGLHVCHDGLANEDECGELRALVSIYADHPDCP